MWGSLISLTLDPAIILAGVDKLFKSGRDPVRALLVQFVCEIEVSSHSLDII
jgi:hypothetical protein